MATEITPKPETDEDLLTRSPAHDIVATQRDLREIERYLVGRFDARIDRLEERINGKIDRMIWMIIGGLGIVLASLITILVQV